MSHREYVPDVFGRFVRELDMIRGGLFIVAVALIVLSILPLVRADALIRGGRRGARRELLRMVLAVAAGSALIVALARTR